MTPKNHPEDYYSPDLRDTPEFHKLKDKIARFVEKHKKVTWRKLRDVSRNGYYVTMAVGELKTDGIVTVDDSKQIEMICSGGKAIEKGLKANVKHWVNNRLPKAKSVLDR